MNATTITTGKVRLSYAHLFTPVKANESAEAKYSVSVIIPKKDTATLDKINAAIEAAKAKGAETKWGGKVPKNLRTPLHDGDAEREDDPAYANSYYFSCSSKRRPGVVDENIETILDPEEVYSGCYARVNVNFYPFATAGNNGIAAGLNHVQKIADGDRFGGGAPSLKAAFGEDGDWDDEE